MHLFVLTLCATRSMRSVYDSVGNMQWEEGMSMDSVPTIECEKGICVDPACNMDQGLCM